MNFVFYFFCIFMLFRASQAFAVVHEQVVKFNHPLSISLLTSQNFSSGAGAAGGEEITYASGISTEYIWLHSKKKMGSLKTEFLIENSTSGEGGFAMNLHRNSLQEWGLFASDLASKCRCALGIGFGIGVSQTQVRSSIEGSSLTATGQFEPLWGIMLDAKILILSNVFLEFMGRKTYANNFTDGNRIELNIGIGMSFF